MYLVVGAGLTGCIIAHKIATQLNKKVKIIDKNDHVAGNLYDYKDENDILIHKYGTHIFHTNKAKTWDFISKFTHLYPYHHTLTARVDGVMIPLPFNLNSIYKLFSPQMAEAIEVKLINRFGYNKQVPILKLTETKDKDLQFLANYIYKSIYLGYISKKRNISIKEIDKEVISKISLFINKKDSFYQDKYQGIPHNGYTKMCEKMIKHKNIELKLKQPFKGIDCPDLKQFDKIIYTGGIDEFFEYKFGKLSYKNFKYKTHSYKMEYFQEHFQVNYPNEYDYISTTEYKHLLNQNTKNTTVVYTYPVKDNTQGIPSYPDITEENNKIYTQYLEESKLLEKCIFAGRLAEFKYFSMDEAIENALEVFESQIK